MSVKKEVKTCKNMGNFNHLIQCFKKSFLENLKNNQVKIFENNYKNFWEKNI